MDILINHLTRMKHPYICVAGIDSGGAHVRPVLDVGQLPRSLLRSEGGVFELGAFIRLGLPEARPTPPEVEDVVFVGDESVHIRRVDPADFWTSVQSVALDRLAQVFGPNLQRLRRTAAAIPEGEGSASLGVIRLSEAALDVRRGFGKKQIRLAFQDADLEQIELKVNDLRLWEADQSTPRQDRVDALQPLLEGLAVSVGLSRAYSVPSYQGRWHWLQINNVFPEGDPLWARE